MDTALLAARLLLAVVFAAAGAAKLAAPRLTATTLSEFRLPRRLVSVGTYALPLVELAVAVALIPASTASAAAIAAAALMAAFSSGVLGILTRGERVDCNCFGAIRSGPVSRWTLLRDFLLFGLAAFVAIAGPGDASSSAIALIGVLSLVAVTAFVLRSRSPESAGRVVGRPAPNFDLPALDGTQVTLAELLADGRGLVIVFSEPSCADCEQSLAAVGRLQQDQGGRSSVVVVSRGGVHANRANASEHGLVTVLLDDGFELARSLGVGGMPGAVALDVDGRIADAPAIGVRAVDRLLGLVNAPGEEGLLESDARRRSSVGRALHS